MEYSKYTEEQLIGRVQELHRLRCGYAAVVASNDGMIAAIDAELEHRGVGEGNHGHKK